jgi:hypothetical protein
MFTSRHAGISVFMLFFMLLQRVSAYEIVREYSGTSFFDRWDFFGSWDNLTLGTYRFSAYCLILYILVSQLGDVWWLSREDATSQNLAYVNEAGHAIMKVDNTSNVLFNDKRNSVRITSQDFYGVGSLWIVDILHLPYGCSV